MPPGIRSPYYAPRPNDCISTPDRCPGSDRATSQQTDVPRLSTSDCGGSPCLRIGCPPNTHTGRGRGSLCSAEWPGGVWSGSPQSHDCIAQTLFAAGPLMCRRLMTVLAPLPPTRPRELKAAGRFAEQRAGKPSLPAHPPPKQPLPVRISPALSIPALIPPPRRFPAPLCRSGTFTRCSGVARRMPSRSSSPALRVPISPRPPP